MQELQLLHRCGFALTGMTHTRGARQQYDVETQE